MTNASPCTSTMPCDSSVAERPRYYPRQIITPDDLTLEQEYFRNKFRRHNRLMHGWGVVCGAKVCVTPATTATTDGTANYQPWKVSITSGYILGPYGDEIVLDCCRTLDVRTSGSTGVTGDACVQASDPWCTDVYQQRAADAPLYIAIKYKEFRGRPVRVQPLGCGCNDNTCEYSRLQDGYELGVLTACPDSGATPPTMDQLGKAGTPDCPACPPQPWVVLAQVTVASDGTVTSIDNCKCRRIVLSFGGFWFGCTSETMQITAVAGATTDVNAQAVPQGAQNVALTVTIKFPATVTAAPKLTGDLGAGITVASLTAGAALTDPYKLLLNVSPTAAVGSRTLTLTTADGVAETSMEDAISIIAAPGSGTAGGGNATPKKAAKPNPGPEAVQPTPGAPLKAATPAEDPQKKE